MRYALVRGLKVGPTPGGRGHCPLCGLEVKAQTDAKIKRWVHSNGSECDPWTEPLTAWHLSWQNLVKPAFAEVPKKGRRADFIGNKGFVIELQKDPISSEAIKARESFFGNMVWVFDASERFVAVRTGTTAFFNYGLNDYPTSCSRLIFLDFGTYLIQVINHTKTFELCSGYGSVRSHRWFAQQLLSGVLRLSPQFAMPITRKEATKLWEAEQPYWTTHRAMTWFLRGERVTVPKGEPFIILNYIAPGSEGFVWGDVIQKYPDLANGWNLAALERMREFLRADVAILRGALRLLPTDVEALSYSSATKAQTRHLLTELEAHIGAGRIPMLPESLKDHLLRIAKSDFRA